MDAKNGWELPRRVHFDEIVADYDKIRPEYPSALFSDVLAYAGAGRGKKALEIGAGTGKATAPFLQAGYRVTAVEIGGNMAAFLRERFKACPDFSVIAAAFEDAPLEEGGYDLVYAASSFHWVNAEIGCPKAFRLLKNGGAIALIRYNAVPAIGEECYEAIQRAYDRHYTPHYPARPKPVKRSREDYEKPSEIKGNFGFEDLAAYGFQEVAMRIYERTRAFSAEEYVAFLDTLSDHRSLPEEDREALYREIKEAIRARGGSHSVCFDFQTYMGKKK